MRTLTFIASREGISHFSDFSFETNGTILCRGIPAIRLVSDDILFRYTYIYHHERFDEKAAICISKITLCPADHESVSVASKTKNAVVISLWLLKIITRCFRVLLSLRFRVCEIYTLINCRHMTLCAIIREVGDVISVFIPRDYRGN